MKSNIIIKYIIYFIIILLLYKLVIKNNEFFDFNNIPKTYNEEIKDINISPEKGIPKIIHHICPNDFKKWHPLWLICYESWLKYYPKPEYTHMHWDDKELDDFISENYPWFLQIFRGYNLNIKRYDISRIFLLYHYGGIYADMDYKVYKNFYDELPQDIVSISESPYKWNEHIQNALMISPPKHNWWLLLMDECYNRQNGYVLYATGPQLLTFIYYKYPNIVNVLPSNIYNPNMYEQDKIDETKIYCKHLLTTTWNQSTSSLRKKISKYIQKILTILYN